MVFFSELIIGLLQNLLLDFKNAFKLPENLLDLQDQKKWADHSIKELSGIVKVFIAFIYDSSLSSDSIHVFEKILGNFTILIIDVLIEYKFGNDLPYSIYFDQGSKGYQEEFEHLCFVLVIEFCKFEVF